MRVELTQEEFAALYAVVTDAEQVNWYAYDQARDRLIEIGRRAGLTVAWPADPSLKEEVSQ
jgi:hypothetical protein